MKVVRIGKRSKLKEKQIRYQELIQGWSSESSRIAMIQMLIPLGLKAVSEELQGEVSRLAGERYGRGGDLKRWGSNPGSVYLGDQKCSVLVPRVRDVKMGREISLNSYEQFQNPKRMDDRVLARVLNGLSTGKYEKAAECIPETFGIKKSSISRKFIRATARKLSELLNRNLKGKDIIALFIDGKHFAGNEMIIAVGVTMEGEKIVLGFIESGTENHQVCRDFINQLMDRGLNTENEILFIIDGSKGLRRGICDVLGEKALIQRCQWHKRENVTRYLAKGQQGLFRRRLQAAYERDTYEKAKRSLESIKRELKLINESAVKSLEEGLEETLTLHRLGMFEKLGTSFKTTNCIETLNHQLGIYTDRVDHWKSSDHRQRWVATALLAIEPNMRKVKGYQHLKELRQVMKQFKNNHSIAA